MQMMARQVPLDQIVDCRRRYRKEMNCQIIHDSIHSRPGWTVEYLLTVDGTTAGYGSVAQAGPWKKKTTIYEFYILPRWGGQSFELFETLVRNSGAKHIETQTNARLLPLMLHTFATNVVSEKILFADSHKTAIKVPGTKVRRMAHEKGPAASKQWSMGGDWIIEHERQVVGVGGLGLHYNRPYADIYMEIAEPFRRRGFGAYLVQELKRACYKEGMIPAARCNPANIASRRTLQRAGLVPCGHLLCGRLHN